MYNNKEANLFNNREAVIDSFNHLLGPLNKYFEEDSSGLELSTTGVGYGRKTASVESLLRLLWGLVPLEAGGTSHPLSEKVLKGIVNGTDPEHEGYWGPIHHYDQLIVEMSAIGYMLLLAPEKFWDPLNEQERKHLVQYLLQVNTVDAHDCNWLFFAVLVNLGLQNVGETFDADVINRNLERIETYYVGNGWYKDGLDAHADYYVPFAIHFYSLIYSVAMKDKDPQRCSVYKERAHLFSKKFVHWFSEEGQGIPYGRSMTYRFSQIAFFCAYLYADVDVKDTGWMKGMILRHFRYWFKQSIFNGDGTLSVGYTYPNLHMSENYNAPGSPYWSLKSFLILAFPEDHAFWKVEEEPFPQVEASYHDSQVEQTILRDKGHVVLFPNGYRHRDAHNHTAAKYEKFAYSTHFGFSIPRSNLTLSEGAFDSMLAVSEDGEDYRVKRQVVRKVYTDEYLFMEWMPWQDVTIKSWIIPGLPWHVRVHKIQTQRPLITADGGFALGVEPADQLEKVERADAALIKNLNGTVGAIDLSGNGMIEVVHPNSNTNLIYSNTVIPSIRQMLEPGDHTLIHGFFGSNQLDCSLKNSMNIQYDENTHMIQINGQKIPLTLSE